MTEPSAGTDRGRSAGRGERDRRFRPSPYRPAWWLPSPHLMTAWGALVRRGPLVELRREEWWTPDDDVLALDFMDGPSGAPRILVLHGLEGCSASLYVHGLLDQARRRGWRGVALNFRSCASPPGRPRGEWLPNLAPRMYHSGETSDLDWVVERLVDAEPDVPLAVAGISLGGNVLLKWLGERGDDAPAAVRAAAVVSVPYDLAAGSRHLERGFGPIYVRHFLKTLKEKALAFDRRHPGIIDAEGARSASTFREYDDAVVAPVHGFDDAADYYARSSSIDRVGEIRVPTLLIGAEDDPFYPDGLLARVRERVSDAVTCLFTERGGHVGFVAGPPWAPRYWDEETAVAFLAAHA